MIRFDAKHYRDEMIGAIARLVNIPSFCAAAAPGAPFGPEIRNVLAEVCSLSEKLGFKTYIDPEGYYAYADIGSGEELVGVLGHLDVVPADDVENWDSDPFTAVVKQGKLYGRGAQDDKGPIVAALYATKYLLDQGVRFERRLRFIFSTDEETLWRGITQYIHKEEKPAFGFSPDSIFPGIHAEKGLLQAKLTSPGKSACRLKGGRTFNAVPDKATVTGVDLDRLSEALNSLGFGHTRHEREITVVGKSCHACTPEKGINAITRLAMALNQMGLKSPSVRFISDLIHTTCNGEDIFGDVEDVSGKLTFNVGTLEIDAHKEEIGLDMRIPVTRDKEALIETLERAIKPYGLRYEAYDYLGPLYVPEENFLVQKLKSVYTAVTGEKSKMLATGGATLARAMENCISFGALLPGRPNVEHQANEYIDIEDLMTCAEIYVNAIHQLTTT